MHLADQRNSVGDALVPAWLSPRVFASLFALLVRFVAPNVVNVVQTANLREESSVGFVVVASEGDGTCPVVAPFNHGAGLETVRAHFVDVVALTSCHDWPVAEGEQVLQMAGTQESTAFCRKLHVILKAEEIESRLEGLKGHRTYGIFLELAFRQIDFFEAAGVTPQVNALIQVADLHRPTGDEFTGQVFLRLNQLNGFLAAQIKTNYNVN